MTEERQAGEVQAQTVQSDPADHVKKKESVRELLQKEKLLFDGSMGTYYTEKRTRAERSCEVANIKEPEVIRGIHREYLEAGARAIKTNTFAVNRIAFPEGEELLSEILEAGWKLAAEEAERFGAYAFADIGPIRNLPEGRSAAEEFIYVVRKFLELGAENFLFETNANAEGIAEAIELIRKEREDAYVIVSFAVQADGYSSEGMHAQELIDSVKGIADAVGLNCVCGARHMLELTAELDLDGVVFSAMPNAGYPTVLRNRTFYEGDPVYYADQLAQLAESGAAIVGGCCGTTPLHTSYAKERLAHIGMEKKASGKKTRPVSADDFTTSPFWEKLRRGEKVVAVELDPPEGIHAAKFMSAAWMLKAAGADIITIADCPISRARMDSSLLACKVRRELGMDAMPHMTCRDRNTNATKALIMGSYAEGIRNILLITGDPIPSAERDEVKSVYQFNSRKLAGYVTSFSKEMMPGPLHLFGALNINARNFDVQLRLAKDKLDKGMVGFLTQPVLTEEAFENLKRAREELSGYILGGIIPVVSERNARFMNSEVNGIKVDEKVIEMYAGKSRSECEKLAVEISSEIAHRIEPYVDGYYLMTVLNKTHIITQIMENL